MKLRTKSIIAAVLALALSVAPLPGLSPVYADDDDVTTEESSGKRIHISPVSQKVTLNPGDKYTGSFQVINHGTETFTYKVYATPYSVTDDDYHADYTTENKYTDISKWITFEKSSGTLTSGQTASLTYAVNVPDDAPGGGQYAVIMAETSNDEPGMIKSVSRVGMILYAHLTGDTNVSGNIIENSVPSIVFAPPVTASSLIENTGNVHETATYTLKVYPFGSDEEIYTNEDNPKTLTLLPETRRYVTQSWDESPSLGIYTVEQTVEFAGQSSTTKKLVIICPIWLLIIFIALILAIIFTVASRARARKQDKKS